MTLVFELAEAPPGGIMLDLGRQQHGGRGKQAGGALPHLAAPRPATAQRGAARQLSTGLQAIHSPASLREAVLGPEDEPGTSGRGQLAAPSRLTAIAQSIGSQLRPDGA